MSPLKNCGGSNSASEGDDKYAMYDEKKRKRMISNKESARRSRMRKQLLLEGLTDEISRLQIANNDAVSRISEITDKYAACEAENNVLRAQVMELTERLRYMNEVIQGSGMAVDATEIVDPLLKPWQTTYPLQPIPASSGLSQF